MTYYYIVFTIGENAATYELGQFETESIMDVMWDQETKDPERVYYNYNAPITDQDIEEAVKEVNEIFYLPIN